MFRPRFTPLFVSAARSFPPRNPLPVALAPRCERGCECLTESSGRATCCAIHFSPLPCSDLGQGVAISTTAFMLPRFFVLFRAQRDHSGGSTLSRAQRDHAGGTTYGGGVFRGKQDPTRERLCSRGPMRERKDEAICRGGCNKEK